MSELDRLDEVADGMETCREFLNWTLAKGIIVDSTQHVYGTMLDTTKFVDEFFEIDPAKVEAKRQELLEVARKRGLV